jgi:hypothetical protein
VTASRRSSGWYAVRCVFHDAEAAYYEERITLWPVASHEEAIAKAEEAAAAYAATLALTYVGLAQSYELFDDPREPGAEVFSLIRDSDLLPDAYVARFFSTGGEHETALGSDAEPELP